MTTDATIIRPASDPYAWVRDLNPGVAPEDQPFPYHRFRVRVPMRAEGRGPFLPLARGRHVAFYLNAFEPGMGERNLHAHDDEAVWLVLAGEATFWTERAREIAHLTQHQGLYIPLEQPYRYQNTGDGLLILLRGAARAEPMDAYRDFFRGSHPGGTESISWRRDPWPGVAEHPEPFRRFNLRLPLRGENLAPWRVLVRGDRLALHSSCLEPGRGEVNLHSHDDEAVWVVLHGEVTFYGGEDNHELCTLRPQEGILIPIDTPYRYVNSGDGYLIMLRYGGRAAPPPPI